MSRIFADLAITSPLLELPREAQDLILQYVLGPDLTTIQFAIVDPIESRVAIDGELGFCEHLRKIVCPVVHRERREIPVKKPSDS